MEFGMWIGVEVTFGGHLYSAILWQPFWSARTVEIGTWNLEHRSE